ncbi:MAG: transcriptional repressor LexA [Christensenellales bacterium]
MSSKNEETKQRIYDFINKYIQDNRVSPTVREIAKGVNCAVSTAYKFMVRLQDEGLIDIAGRRHIISSINSWSMSCAPIVGLVARGKPQTAIQDIQGYLPINTQYFGGGEYFALVAEGKSMVNVGIDEGDLVIIRRQSSCDDGQIAVVLIDNENYSECSATLKRLYRDDKHKRFRLHPENDEMEDFFAEKVEVVGVAVKVIKDLS